MLKPVLRHNRYEFERLNDLKNDVFVGGLVLGFLLMVVLVVVDNSAPWFRWVVVSTVPAMGAAIGVLEIRKTRVFFRDLRERRESGDEG